MKKINHFFRGENTLLAKGIIESFLQNLHIPMHFVIYFNVARNENEFIELFKKYNFSDYEFWIKDNGIIEKKWFIKFYMKHPLVSRCIKKMDIYLMYHLFHFSGSNLILHSELDINMAYSLNHVNYKLGWVCWGCIPKAPLFRMPFFRRYTVEVFVKKCNKILCLSLADERIIKERFGVNSSVFCPYLESFEEADIPVRTENKILVGNSLFYMYTYLDVSEKLSKFSLLDVTFLCAYGSNGDYQGFKTKAKKILSSSKVHFWEDTVNYSKYIERIRTYSVYICNVQRQTGIGACNACLDNGVKLYLTGGNYEHYTKLGLKVYNYDELCNHDELFDFPETYAESNRRIIRHVYGKEMFVKRYTDVINSFIV